MPGSVLGFEGRAPINIPTPTIPAPALPSSIRDPTHPKPDCKACLTWVDPPSDDISAKVVNYSSQLLIDILSLGKEGQCPICAILFELRGTLAHDFLLIEQAIDGESRTRLKIHIRHGGKGDNVRLFCTSDRPCPWGFFPVEKETLSRPGVFETLRVATPWIRRCTTNHACGAVEANQLLPTRLLQVGRPGEDQVRLIQTQPGSCGRYLCLSHCWGSHANLKTTTGTLAKMTGGFSVFDLPLTYRDAVHVTRALGVDYIWIDSLCILQDSAADWLAESARMADIYSKAFLTLASTWGSSSASGLLRSKTESEVLGTTNDTGLPYRILAQKELHNVSLHHQESLQHYLPLLSRGWVFQERLLSPRVLHFGPDELFWECMKETWCECEGLWEKLGISKMEYADVLANGDDDALAYLWRCLVEENSCTRITKPSDKLPALAGVAKQFLARRRGKSTYIAGIWSSTLLEDMLWRVTAQGDEVHGSSGLDSYKPANWRAPSWSWAAVDCEVRYPMSSWGLDLGRCTSQVLATHAKVEDIQYVAAGPDITAEAKTARVRIRGRVFRGTCTARKAGGVPRIEYDIEVKPIAAQDMEVKFSTSEMDESLKLLNGRSVFRWRTEKLVFDCLATSNRREVQQDLAGLEVTFLPLIRLMSHKLDDSPVEYILLLRPAKDIGTYERIGLARRANPEAKNPLWESSETFEDVFSHWGVEESIIIV